MRTQRFRAGLDRVGSVEAELELGAGNADVNHPRGEATLRLVRCADGIRYLVPARAHELQHARQVEALCRPGDLLILHTTSGKSPNLLRAASAAREKGVATLALSAKGGGPLASMVDHSIVVPTDRTDRAQEIQLCISHAICESIDEEVFAE